MALRKIVGKFLQTSLRIQISSERLTSVGRQLSTDSPRHDKVQDIIEAAKAKVKEFGEELKKQTGQIDKYVEEVNSALDKLQGMRGSNKGLSDQLKQSAQEAYNKLMGEGKQGVEQGMEAAKKKAKDAVKEGKDWIDKNK